MTINENAQQALQRQKLLLQMEYYAEKEAFRKQTYGAQNEAYKCPLFENVVNDLCFS